MRSEHPPRPIPSANAIAQLAEGDAAMRGPSNEPELSIVYDQIVCDRSYADDAHKFPRAASEYKSSASQTMAVLMPTEKRVFPW